MDIDKRSRLCHNDKKEKNGYEKKLSDTLNFSRYAICGKLCDGNHALWRRALQAKYLRVWRNWQTR
ncbi:MAG: hypothetical protein II368_06435 [Clostridia bacterium]|nr:hypothetical protein [Clostridia bacterium]MBQ1943259.1 hypothetical protein [Clostridia bacterium]